jgi:hypothetical protein
MTGSCWNGTTAFTVAALAGTYLGSLYCTTGATSPACVTMQFKPSAVSLGSNNVLGLYNAYNRAPTFSIERDADLGWNTTTASTWEKAANSSNNRVTFLDPLQQSKITSTVANTYLDSSAASTFFIGQLLDSASGTPNLFARQTTSQAGFALAPAVTENFPPLLGIHFIQSMELSDVSGAATLWNAVAGEYALTISLEM